MCLKCHHILSAAGAEEDSQFRGAKYPKRKIFYDKKLNPMEHI